MKITELKDELRKRPTANVKFVLPNDESIPVHAHVTEVARIDKRFIDCGGTFRNATFCRLQTWFSDDVDHRLTAGKLAKILDLATPILGQGDMEVDVECQLGFITQFPLSRVEENSDELILRLSERKTACLAPEKCKSPTSSANNFDPLKFDFRQSPSEFNCCSPKKN